MRYVPKSFRFNILIIFVKVSIFKFYDYYNNFWCFNKVLCLKKIIKICTTSIILSFSDEKKCALWALKGKSPLTN